MYNATYDAIKAAYPDMQVGAAATTTGMDVILTGVLASFPTKLDFISYHEYRMFQRQIMAQQCFLLTNWLWANIRLTMLRCQES